MSENGFGSHTSRPGARSTDPGHRQGGDSKQAGGSSAPPHSGIMTEKSKNRLLHFCRSSLCLPLTVGVLWKRACITFDRSNHGRLHFPRHRARLSERQNLGMRCKVFKRPIIVTTAALAIVASGAGVVYAAGGFGNTPLGSKISGPKLTVPR